MLGFLLFLPFWVIFLQRRLGLTITQATLVDVAFWFGMTLTEIPTGAVADTYGRKLSIAIGLVTISIASFLFAVAPGFWWMLLANFMWSTGFTFDSGAGTSLLYESLKQEGQEARFTGLRGYLSASGVASVGLAALVGGFIAERWLAGTFIIYGFIVLLGLLFVATLKEPPFEPDPDTGERIQYLKAVRLAFSTIFRTPNLLFVILYDNVLPLSVISVAALFIQPHAQALGISLFWIGVVGFYLRITRMVGSLASGRVVKALGAWRWIHIAPILVVLSTLALGLIPNWLGILLFAVAGIAQSISQPLDESLILNYAPGPARATILSINALVLTFFISLFEPGLGLLADLRGMPSAFTAMAGIILIPIAAVLFLWRRTWDDRILDLPQPPPAPLITEEPPR
jgi:MFS family permease